MDSFNSLFDRSCLPDIINKAKTISKKECEAIFNYFVEYKPINVLEFGTQHGCSTRVFLEMSKWLGYKINIHAWDIEDKVRYINKKDFTLHIENLENKEKSALKYKPDLMFLDAHPYNLTKNLAQICLDNKINFICHDISFPIIERLRNVSDNFKNKNVYYAWEPYVLSELIDKSILTQDKFENDKVMVDCIRDLYGVAIIKNKI